MSANCNVVFFIPKISRQVIPVRPVKPVPTIQVTEARIRAIPEITALTQVLLYI
jgi:hypothetical protein